MAQPHIGLVNVLEYFRLEENSATKHEYVAGELYASAGDTRRHNRITMNIASYLLAASRGGPCRVSMVDVKLRASEDVFYYPDVMVACGAEPEEPTSEEAPCLIVEVASPSTQSIDKREKMLMYKRIPSVLAYLIVHQDEPCVERHWREPRGDWQYEVMRETGVFGVPCPQTQLSFDIIYEGSGAAR